jgi:hypothetical protein
VLLATVEDVGTLLPQPAATTVTTEKAAMATAGRRAVPVIRFRVTG